ncbi:MAG: helix-turn-helix domain-containing protein [Actinobacteria bacterium]|nr:helix-turn-helix domain-containing protein [Thermoleophilia bacterium]MCB9012179.1 helix-turn-helix domain-containing protein [Actinomycetota bacterium]
MARSSETSPAVAAAGALAHPTRRRIADALSASDDGLSVFEIAEAVGVHHNAVRQHLRRLGAVGLVSVRREAPSGRGRPRLRYRLVDPRIPQIAAHQDLVRMLVEYLVRCGASLDDVERFGRDQGKRLGQDGGRDAVIDSFARLGFSPREVGTADASSGVLELRLDSCPFREGAASDGGELVCVLHRGIAAGIAQRANPGAALTGWWPRPPAIAGCMAAFTGLSPREDG